MPCDTIQKSSVNLELKVENQTHLVNALKALGYQITYFGQGIEIGFRTPEGLDGNLRGNRLRMTGRSGQPEAFDVNVIKRAYSREVVKSQAKKFNWKLKQTTDEFTFEVEKDSEETEKAY